MSETTPFVPQNGEQVGDVDEVAGRELAALSRLVEVSFAEIGQSVSEELIRLSADSQQTMRDMVDGVLKDLARLAARQLIQRPLDQAVNGVFEPSDQAPAQLLSTIVRRSVRNG